MEIKQDLNRIMTAEKTLPEGQISNAYQGLRVLGMLGDISACGYYRVLNPLHMLKLHGATVEYGSFHSFDKFLNYDVIISPRQHNPEVYELIRTLVWEGKLVIYELDDDLDAVLPDSPAYTFYHQGSPELAGIHRVMKACLGMTCTTTEIAKWYSQNVSNIAVIDNYIDYSFRDWAVDVKWNGIDPIFTKKPIQKLKEWEGKIVVGYAGGSTHGPDLKNSIGPGLKHVLNKYDNVIFAIYTSPDLASNLIKEHQLPIDKISIVPPRHFMDYPAGLHGFDIALAPIVPCQFNLAKSSLKQIEMGAAGAIPICSNVGPYAKYAQRHPGMSYLVGRGKDNFSTWGEAISYFVDRPELLAQKKEEIRDFVLNNYSLERNFHKWPAAWQAIHNNVNKGIVGPPDKPKPKEHYRTYGKLGRNDKCLCGSGLKYSECCIESFG